MHGLEEIIQIIKEESEKVAHLKYYKEEIIAKIKKH